MKFTPTTPFDRPVASEQAAPVTPSFSQRLGAYIALTKPRIIELLLITTVPTMFLAAQKVADLGLMVHTLGGGALAAASSNVFNCILDRDIDAVMNRTRKRPLATGTISPRAAAVFAVLLAGGALAWLGLAVNWLSAGLAMSALVIYVVLYTIVLKRRTPQNIVWGGIAGCMPVLIGWSAVTGRLDWPPLALFLVVFFWTPPHYWPLSIKFRADYAKAGVPMAPVVHSPRRVGIEMIAYTVAMIASSLALTPLAQMTWVYTLGALAAGVWFLALVVNWYRRVVVAGKPAKGKEMVVFHGSIAYLTIVSVLVAIDPLLR